MAASSLFTCLSFQAPLGLRDRDTTFPASRQPTLDSPAGLAKPSLPWEWGEGFTLCVVELDHRKIESPCEIEPELLMFSLFFLFVCFSSQSHSLTAK